MKPNAWKPPSGDSRTRWWLVHRVLPGSVLLVALAAFFFFLAQPLFHPRVHLLFAAADYRDGRMLSSSPSADLTELHIAPLAILADAHAKENAPPTDAFASPAALGNMLDRIHRKTVRQGDVLVVWLSGELITRDGRPQLLCENFAPADLDNGCFDLGQVFERLENSNAGTKFLVLDMGRVNYCPRLGTIANTKPSEIASLVAASHDPGLWVLLSHGDLERSHVLSESRQSALAHFSSEGMHGPADANGDRYLDVGEFYHFVRHHVSEFVREQTGGRDAQTPQLLWGGGKWDEKTKFPVLMPVQPPPQPASAEEGEEEEEGHGAESHGAESHGEHEAAPEAESHEGHAESHEGHGEAEGHGHGEAKDAKTPAPPPPPPTLNPPPAALMAARPPETKLDGRAGFPGESHAPAPAAAEAKGAEGGTAPSAGEGHGEAGHTPAASAQKAPLPGVDPVLTAPPAELAAMGWSVHDRLAASARLRPVSTAPHLWRAFEDCLVEHELALQAGDERKLAQLTPQVRRYVRQANDLADGRTPQSYRPHDALPELSIAAAPPSIDLPARSLAMAQRLTLYGGPRLPPEIAAAATRVNSALAAADKSDLQKWSKDAPAAVNNFVELRLARRLAARDDVNWKHVKLVMTATFAAERSAAAALDAGPWTSLSIERADALRQLGQRLVLEPVRPGDPQSGEILLGEALAEYARATGWNDDAAGLEQSIDGALYILPDLLRWSTVSAASSSGGEEAEKAYEKLVDVLRQAIAVIDAPSPAHLPEVRRLRLELDDTMAKLRQTVARELNLPADANLHADAPTGRVVQSDAALQDYSSLPDPGLAACDLRRRLLAVSLGAAAKGPEAVEGEAEEHDRGERASAARERFESLVGLLTGEEKSHSTPHGEHENETKHAEHEKHEHHEKHAEFTDDAARKLLESLPATIHHMMTDNQDLSDPAQRPARLRQLRAAARLATLLDPWDVGRMDGPPPIVLVRRARFYDQYVWEQQRLTAEAAAASPSDRTDLLAAAEVYGQAAAALPQQPPLSAVAQSGVAIDALKGIDLADKAERDVSLTVENHDEERQAVWLTADYDPEVLELLPGDDGRDRLYDARAISGEPIYFAGPMSVPVEAQPADAASAYREADRAAIKGRSPTFLLVPGESHRVWVRIRRKTLAGGDARVIFQAIAAPAKAAGDSTVATTTIFRHDLLVQLPRRLSVDLVATGTADSWQAGESGLLLYPFPNQATAYRFFLVNTSALEREVSVDIYRTETPAAATAPRGDVPVAIAQQYLSRVGGTALVTHADKIVLPATGERVAVPFVPPGKEAKPPAAAGAKPEAAAGSGEPPQPALSPVLAVVITERASGRCAVKTVEILTQRPARYLQTRGDYDPLRRRFDLTVRARKAEALPPEGVHIIAIPQVAESDGVYHAGATLRRDAPEATLHIEVPRDIGGVYPVAVEVDGFARAFCYEVPTRATSAVPVPPVSRAAVRILKPKAGTLYGPQTTDVPVELEIDVPHGLLLDASNCVELGLDTDRDRELEHEDTVRLSSDRQVDLTADAIAPDGKFVIGTKVADLKYKLPPPSRRALRVNVLARLFMPEAIVWSEPVEVIFDNQPPRMSKLQLDPGGKVTEGDDLLVSVLASDNELSGVAKVEAAFDLQRKGEFGTPPPVPGSMQADGRWEVVLPTKPLKPGLQTVLIRATDRCDNASEYLKTTVQIVPKVTAAAEKEKPPVNQLTGRVVYGRFEKRAVADATVQLTAKAAAAAAAGAPAPQVRETKTDADGNFRFTDVPPGDYTVASEKLLGGNRRAGHADAKVPAPPQTTPAVELILETAR